jgi:hypothetical protein
VTGGDADAAYLMGDSVADLMDLTGSMMVGLADSGAVASIDSTDSTGLTDSTDLGDGVDSVGLEHKDVTKVTDNCLCNKPS